MFNNSNTRIDHWKSFLLPIIILILPKSLLKYDSILFKTTQPGRYILQSEMKIARRPGPRTRVGKPRQLWLRGQCCTVDRELRRANTHTPIKVWPDWFDKCARDERGSCGSHTLDQLLSEKVYPSWSILSHISWGGEEKSALLLFAEA